MPLALTQDVDVVVATVPALPNLVAGRVIAWIKGVPYVVEMRDAWPDLIFESESGGKLFGTLVADMVTRIQRYADQLITVTKGFAETLEQRNMHPIEVISNSRAIEQMPPIEARSRAAGELNVLYLGNHGESQQLELVIEAAKIARQHNPNISVRFVGEGTQKANLETLNTQAGQPVTMLPASFGEATLQHYQWADTCMVTLRSDWASFAHTVPSKTYELLSYGKHITGIVCGEAAAILGQAGEHALVPDDAHALAETWLGLAANPQSTPTQETASCLGYGPRIRCSTNREKLDSVLQRNVPAQKNHGVAATLNNCCFDLYHGCA